MKKRILGPVVLAAGLAALWGGPAWAVQNVANTSQKGSLLIFPLITVDPENASNTLIEISNDQNTAVHIECTYVNERKDRVDFDFHLTGKATLSWEVLTGSGDIAAPLFPSGGSFAIGNPARGELICFATDVAVLNQIAFNHLTGTATVVALADADALQKKQAFRYNAFAFIARDTSGNPAADNTVQGTAGDLQLTGANDGKSYDGCPAYNIVNFMPNGARLNGVFTVDNDLAGVSCNQDLKQDFKFHTTKLKFTIWNVNENSFTGTYICADSVFSVDFGPLDRTPALVNGSNFDFGVLRTDNARYQVKGIPSTQCPAVPWGTTETSALLGVATASVALAGGTVATSSVALDGEDAELGSTTQGAGLEPGFVLWDPAGSVVFTGKKQRHHAN